ncbi:hypothetical protein GLA29479_187 [Lysobacter antibioticus]|nr:hypothetical protein GLA29479_187 [Lysobacter antibioticus]
MRRPFGGIRLRWGARPGRYRDLRGDGAGVDPSMWCTLRRYGFLSMRRASGRVGSGDRTPSRRPNRWPTFIAALRIPPADR